MTRKMKMTIGGATAAVVVAIAAVGMNTGWGHADSIDMEESMDKIDPVGPAFSADSAYAFTQAQCDFGPRAMNTEGHDRCAQWIEKKFEEYGCQLEIQQADVKGYDGTTLKCRNIIARSHPERSTRIMLCAHWDSRPWADNDPDSTNWRKPILAANDAASGVAVMLEVARLIHRDTTLNIGVDFVCFDAEDWGTPQWINSGDSESTWALGAQHFASHLPDGFEVRYAILLDMVGGEGARFYKEGMSMQFAPEIVKKVWRAARKAGYGNFFPRQEGGMVTDDHIPLNQTAHIPAIDIIPFYPDCAQSSFGPTWHTLNDNMEHISRNTLKAVGQTMIQVIYTEE